MFLKSVAVRGFQSYRTEQLVLLDKHLTLVAGRNNVGKSALLRATRALAEPPEGAHPDFALRFTWRVPGAEVARVLAAAGEAVAPLRDQAAEADGLDLIAEFTPLLPAPGVAPTFPAGQVTCSRLELPDLKAVALPEPHTKKGWESGTLQNAPAGLDQVVAYATNLASAIYYCAPRRIQPGRQFFNANRPTLAPDASNLTWVQMWLGSKRPRDIAPAINDFMRSAFPDIELINVDLADDASAGSSLAGELVVHYEGRPDAVPLRNCGTGVEQMLALATAVLFSEGPRVILIDEPQAYLHPHAEAVLLELLERHPEHQYVIATHSPLMLRAQPLTRARLLTLQGGETRIHSAVEPEAVLNELGVKASDLWLNDRLLWVEGESDVAVLEVMVEREWTPSEAAGLAIRAMPLSASRFSQKKEASASKEFRFVEQVVEAVAPLGVTMTFLFDRDAHDAAAIAKVERASAGRARFLAERELEALFLDSRVLTPVCAALCSATGVPEPEPADVSSKLAESAAEPSAARRLNELFLHFTRAGYVKTRDAPALATAALDHAPELLDPFRVVLDSLRRRR